MVREGAPQQELDLPTPGRPGRYDYHPPGLTAPDLLPHFDSLEATEPREDDWRYLRGEVPHHWRVDRRSIRSPRCGVLSVEEAMILYACATQFAGRRGLEIGCHFGWSAAHLLAAGLDLDIVDPALAFEDQRSCVESRLRGVGGPGRFRLWAAPSPAAIPEVSAAGDGPWSIVFIDGDHERDAPRADADAVADLCAPDACVLFHDLVAPAVARGLGVFADRGWNVGIYNTMQVMGIAWRGDVALPDHVYDRAAPVPAQPHLETYELLSR